MPEISVRVPVTYNAEWQDGYGARGWKLDVAIDDPEVIAATAETGRKLPTSVLVHDILDHYLCGLALGGHRNEAIALHQLGLRTGADPLPDLMQMVDEDLIHGVVVGEPMRILLSDEHRALLPPDLNDDGSVIEYHAVHIGRDALRQSLLQRLRNIGRDMADAAMTQYRRSGLDPARRGLLGLALQNLLVRIDARAISENWHEAHGEFALSDHRCVLEIDIPYPLQLDTHYP
ncbi:MAG: hypothetical protein Q8M58_01520 [Anaerolineales bacterium]|nr:hypothetical protein [Anaerolineales bacterium]